MRARRLYYEQYIPAGLHACQLVAHGLTQPALGSIAHHCATNALATYDPDARQLEIVALGPQRAERVTQRLAGVEQALEISCAVESAWLGKR